MPRNKYPEKTVELILDVALDLFYKKGYDNTTIQDIVDNLNGLSKGVIYHHFKSKEDILEKLMHYSQHDYNAITGKNGLEKLRNVLELSLTNLSSKKMLMTSKISLRRSEALNGFITHTVVDKDSKIIEKYIDEGIADKSLSCTNSKELSQIVMLLFNVWASPVIFDMTKDEFIKKMKFCQSLFNTMKLPILTDDLINKAVTYLEAIFID